MPGGPPLTDRTPEGRSGLSGLSADHRAGPSVAAVTGVCLEDDDAAARAAYVLSRLAEAQRTMARAMVDPDASPERTEGEGQ